MICRHQHTKDETTTGCTSPDLVHAGRVPLSVCQRCPYLRKPISGRDYLGASAALGVQLQRRGLKKANPKPCGGCKGNTVVWVYWEAGATSDELRYSIRSVAAHLSGVSNLVICGDRPTWWDGDFIPAKKFGSKQAKRKFGSRRYVKWCDSIAKLQRIIGSQLVTDDFLWMYDDTFILEPMSFAQIAIPRAGGSLSVSKKPVRHAWREVSRRTGVDLKHRGFPVHNYSTHYPAVYNKDKLRQTIELFDLPRNPRLIESLYQNHHHRRPEHWRPVFQYVKRVPRDWKPRAVPVVNVGSFNAAARAIIRPMFPEPINQEKSELANVGI